MNNTTATMTTSNGECFEAKNRFVPIYHIKNFFKRIGKHVGLTLVSIGNGIAMTGLAIAFVGTKLVKKSKIVPTTFLKFVKVETPNCLTTSGADLTITNEFKQLAELEWTHGCRVGATTPKKSSKRRPKRKSKKKKK